ncbi:MAG: hypothetical protein JSW50_00075, partial [Candidatus Latescibacterota bacterium]
MGTVNEPESVDLNGPERQIKNAPEAADILVSGADKKPLVGNPMGQDLPVEPRVAWEEPVAEGYDPKQTFTALRSFYLYGSVGLEPVEHASPSWPTPALLARYNDLSRIRYDYPIVVTDEAGDNPVRTLTEIVDDIVAALTDEGDEGNRLKRRIYQLESKVKALADD